ncbi:MAG: DEAD/DEAH box helicase [Gemmatimonadota bacterium]|nr:DEAD/DEAH box helicase [Gemmatimonadota bacterium]
MISPTIHRLQPALDPCQQAVVGHLAGPLLVIAGPGAGKTRCLVWRAVNLLLLGQAGPAELVMCTFSKRAARELRQRFHAAAEQAGCPDDLSAVRVATVHSLCRRILCEHAKRAGLKSSLDILDEWRQLDLLSAHFHRVFGPDRDELRRRGWRTHDYTVRQGRRYIERIAEEAVDLEELADADDPFHSAIGRCCLRYQDVLRERGALDFSRLQVEADSLLQDDAVAQSVGANAKHLMVDEYQDTSFIQERVLLRLAQVRGNLAVVGDDDQSIYRFRGASVRNLLEFPERFPKAQVRHLSTNYRSHPGIVAAYDRWMAAFDWSNPKPDGRPFRHPKTIIPNDAVHHADYPSVIAVLGKDPRDEAAQLAELLRLLKVRGVIADYGQAALLLHSVQERFCERYLSAFAKVGIPYHRAPASSRLKHPASESLGKGSSAESRFPAGRVCVTTIHQSKGLEWPVVAMGSLDGSSGGDEIGRELDAYSHRPPFEPPNRIRDFDAMRQHYVAFSRARNLLVLTASAPPAPRFSPIWDGLPRWPNLSAAALSQLLSQRFASEPTVGAPRQPANLVIPHVKRLVVRPQGGNLIAS